MTTFRAAYFVAADGQSDVLLTTEDMSHLSDTELTTAAIELAAEMGMDEAEVREGLRIGDYNG